MRLDNLIDYFKNFNGAAVAFSGGVDSSVVAAAAYKALRDKSLAVTVVSEFVPDSELRQASSVAGAIGIRHEVLRMSVLEDEKIASNPPERCYHCKKGDFGVILKLAKKYGFGVFDGTNDDDTKARRPGLKALCEMGIKSPLMELGIGKEEVRRIARELRLPNSERPSSPCLASRFPYGMRITGKDLEKVGQAEEFLRSMGFIELRVRHHGNLARIELAAGDMPLITAPGQREKVVAKLTALGYNYVALDLKGFRSGSMDEVLPS
ncbi:MAG: ATP-dependent sacrificial sulfur transferase LarE [Nitrospirota bacterium]